MATSTRTTIDGRELTVSNLDKVLFPQSGFTKGQLIDYYVRIAPALLPHLRERPLTMKRYPDGVEGKSFFEKHIPSHAPDWVSSVDVSASSGEDVIPYAMVNDLPTLAWAANLGTIELHVPLWHVGRRRKLPGAPRSHGLRPRSGRRHHHRRVLRGRRLHDGRAGTAGEPRHSPRPAGPRASRSTRRWGRGRPGTAYGPRPRDRPQAGIRPPRLVVSNMRKTLRRDACSSTGARTTRPRRPWPSTRSAPCRADGLHTGHSRRGAPVRRRRPGILRFETSDVLRRVDTHGDLFAPLGLLAVRLDTPHRRRNPHARGKLWRTGVLAGTHRASTRCPTDHRVEDLAHENTAGCDGAMVRRRIPPVFRRTRKNGEPSP